jgi:hypothetical protein
MQFQEFWSKQNSKNQHNTICKIRRSENRSVFMKTTRFS